MYILIYMSFVNEKVYLLAFTGTLSTIPRDIKVGYVIAIPKFNIILNAEIRNNIFSFRITFILLLSAFFYRFNQFIFSSHI